MTGTLNHVVSTEHTIHWLLSTGGMGEYLHGIGHGPQVIWVMGQRPTTAVFRPSVAVDLPSSAIGVSIHDKNNSNDRVVEKIQIKLCSAERK